MKDKREEISASISNELEEYVKLMEHKLQDGHTLSEVLSFDAYEYTIKHEVAYWLCDELISDNSSIADEIVDKLYPIKEDILKYYYTIWCNSDDNIIEVLRDVFFDNILNEY